MEHIQVSSYHPVAENDAEQGEIKDCPVMFAEHKKTQKKEAAHKHTAGEDAIISSVPVFFQEKLVLIPDQDMFVGAAPKLAIWRTMVSVSCSPFGRAIVRVTQNGVALSSVVAGSPFCICTTPLTYNL